MGQFCCVNAGKFCVVFVSLFYLLTGLAVIGLSTYLLLEPEETSVLELTRNDEYLYYGKLFLLVSGCLMLLAGILGCCGGFKRSSACLSLFLAIVLIISLSELAAGVYAYLHRDEFMDYFKGLMKNSLQTRKDEVMADAWNLVQTEMHCCGADSYRDYQSSKSATIDMTLSSISSSSSTFSVPISCCKADRQCEPANLNFGPDSSDVSAIYTEGCSEKVIQWLNDQAYYIIATLLVIGSVQLLCLLFTCFLICAFRSRRQTKY